MFDLFLFCILSVIFAPMRIASDAQPIVLFEDVRPWSQAFYIQDIERNLHPSEITDPIPLIPDYM